MLIYSEKRIAIKLSTTVSKQTARVRSPSCCKREQNKVCDLVDQAFSQFNENLINNQDPHSQIENEETSGAGYYNENDSKDTETNKTFAVTNFKSQTLPDDEIAKGINSLNLKQREVFNVVHA